LFNGIAAVDTNQVVKDNPHNGVYSLTLEVGTEELE
jgi:hypothetical protein